MTNTTSTSAAAWRPDQTAYFDLDRMPDLLLPQVATVAGSVEGDAVAVRVPYVETDGISSVVAEGAPITESDPEFAEVVVMTRKIATLSVVSLEQYRQPEARHLILESLQRSVTREANKEFISAVGALSADFISGGTLGENLDSISDAVAEIEANDGRASHIVMPASAWQTLAKVKQATGSNMPLLGVGTNSTEGSRRSIFDLPVILSATAPAVYVLSKGDLLAATGQIAVSISEHAAFNRDAVSMRSTLRFGIAPSRPERHAVIALS
ncbi:MULTISPECIES: phage major capsid protein [unclassified Aeromicrobium]|jgi:HK97 family phage major capsid protein|uniref:phage major capsid protein n=1 Tax=unclassified Aeromicrobium TaxID=2633570 RepID=UPI000B16F82F|nr:MULTISPECIES: phage major capsid protein [unclassified Aeromicrobium]